MTIVVLSAIALALAAIGALLLERSGIRGRIVASDGPVSHPARVMRSAHYGVSGKPDYLVEEEGRIVPVELKPSRTSATPWLRDVVQLATYCLLLEETEPRFGGYGYLRYAERSFRIDFSDSLKAELLRTISAMRADLESADVDPSHDEPARCARCALRQACGRPVRA